MLKDNVVVLSRDAILGADDLEKEPVEVPEWGGSVYVRVMTGEERDRFEESLVKQKGKDTEINYRNLRAKLVALTAVDGDGNRIFKDGDEKRLGQKSAAALQRVFAVAQRLNGMTKEDVEELTGNSESDQSDDSGSD